MRASTSTHEFEGLFRWTQIPKSSQEGDHLQEDVPDGISDKASLLLHLVRLGFVSPPSLGSYDPSRLC